MDYWTYVVSGVWDCMGMELGNKNKILRGKNMHILINIKSGTGGYYDYDGCDLCLKEIKCENFPIPRIGESIDILEDNDKKKTNSKGDVLKEYNQYLVTDVRYWISDNTYGVTVYVVPIGRNVNH